MIVVGGTYVETTDYPACRTVAGSGLRAAGALAEHNPPTLHTAVDSDLAEEAASTAAALKVHHEPVERDEVVGFRYFTPLSSPTIDGPSAILRAPIDVADDTVLLFGMIERGQYTVRGDRVVLDPQRPRDLTRVTREGITANQLALVCNRAEIRAIGQSDDLLDAARSARDAINADVVVVKRGAVGCTVVHGDQVDHVGPHPTRTVWPIGAGDVFAAGFAHAWDRGADPVQAARVGSAVASWWCGTRSPTVPSSILNGDLEAAPALGPSIVLVEDPTVYLAGPFFCLAERWLIETTRNALVGLGANVFSPVHDVGPGGDEVAAKNLAGLNETQAVLALIDGYDSGTIYECGWARHAGIPVIGYGANAAAEGAKMLVGDGVEIHADFASAVYRAIWAAMGATVMRGRIPGPLEQ